MINVRNAYNESNNYEEFYKILKEMGVIDDESIRDLYEHCESKWGK